jgi:hypothetical protein
MLITFLRELYFLVPQCVLFCLCYSTLALVHNLLYGLDISHLKFYHIVYTYSFYQYFHNA